MIAATFSDRHANAIASIPDRQPIPGSFDVGASQLEFLLAVAKHAGIGLDDPIWLANAEMIRTAWEVDERPQVVAGIVLENARRGRRFAVSH